MFLFNDKLGLNTDFVSSQMLPIESGAHPGYMIEPIEWTEDGKCSSDSKIIKSTVGLKAKCTHPYSDDPIRN
jgi:hypothetical protein